MAERRMFSKKIIDTDAFLDMPLSTRLLYYDLAMRADDDGFISSPKKITRMIGCSEDDLKLLIVKQFIIPFESGVCVIKDWRIHNYIQKDRYHGTQYVIEKSQLKINENGSYTKCIQDASKMDTEVRLEIELGKDSLEQEIIPPYIPPEGENNNEVKNGESLLVETATGESNADNPSTTRKPRTRKTELSQEQLLDFEMFWKVWPNKVSRGQAEKTWLKLNPNKELLNKIIRGVNKAIRYDHRFKPGGFTPHSSTWLNDKGWLDELGGDVVATHQSDHEQSSNGSKQFKPSRS